MKIKAEPSVAVGVYMVMVTSCVLKIPTVPLATSIRPGTFSKRNRRVLEELKRRLKNEIYGFPQVDENPTMSDAEYFGWTAAC